MNDTATPPELDADRAWDVVVVGGGNAGLCAAIVAAEAGATVLLLDSAPESMRGGNSRHTRNLRCAHEAPDALLSGRYSGEEFLEDLVHVTEGRTDEALARLVIGESACVRAWMHERGVRFQPALRGALHLSRTNAFFLGGGKTLVNAYYHAARGRGVVVRYESEVRDFDVRNGTCASVRIERNGAVADVRARAFVVASGGFQANVEWLRNAWGAAADNFVVRGTPYATGRALRALLERGAEPVGDPTQCHAVAVDARAPTFDGGIVTRLDCVPFGIVVDRDARRFADEGLDFWSKRYAVWGRLVAQQLDQVAYVILDAKADGLSMPSVYPAVEAGSVRELAARLGLDPGALSRTVAGFNAATRPGSFDPHALDDCATGGLDPPKSHWARPLDTPPFRAYALRPGITFTYLGVRVDVRARVLREGGRAFDNVFAAGEIMAGNILGQGYLAGLGMTIGTVFGRIAGAAAAARAQGDGR